MEARAQLGVRHRPEVSAGASRSGSVTAVGLSENAATVAFPARNYVEYQLGLMRSGKLDFWGKYRRGVEHKPPALLASVADTIPPSSRSPRKSHESMW